MSVVRLYVRPQLMESCQVQVYSGRGSGQVQTKTDEGRSQRFGQRLAWAGVVTDWIQ